MADEIKKTTNADPMQADAINEEMVTIERYTDMLQAELAKGRLDSAGIESFLSGENAGRLYGNGLDSVQLQVMASDEDDARAILNDPGPADSEVTSVA
jgi:hypothetical protein